MEYNLLWGVQMRIFIYISAPQRGLYATDKALDIDNNQHLPPMRSHLPSFGWSLEGVRYIRMKSTQGNLNTLA